MPVAHYDASIAYDQKVKRGVPGQVARVFHPITDLPIDDLLDLDGNPIAALVSNSQGFVEPFEIVDGPPHVKMSVGSLRYYIVDLNLVGSSAEAAILAAAAAERAASLVEAPADEVVKLLIEGDSLSQGAGDARWLTNAGTDAAVGGLLSQDGSEAQAAADARYMRTIMQPTAPPVTLGAMWIDSTTGKMHYPVDRGANPLINNATNPSFESVAEGSQDAPVPFKFTAISQNLRYSSLDTGIAGQNWADRLSAVASIFNDSGADIVGYQESYAGGSVSSQVRQVIPLLTNPNDWGVAEGYSPNGILYKLSKFDLLQSAVSISINKTYIVDQRSLTYAIFRHKESGRRLIFASTHLTVSGEVGGREESAEIIGKFLQDLRYSFTDRPPVILTGDFNDANTAAGSPFAILASYGLQQSIARATSVTNPTFNSYNGFDPTMGGRQSGSRIDAVLVTSDVAIPVAGVYVKFASGSSLPLATPLPSDHNMIRAEVSLTGMPPVKQQGAMSPATVGGGAVVYLTSAWSGQGAVSAIIDPRASSSSATAMYPAGQTGAMGKLLLVPGKTYTVAADLHVPAVQTGALDGGARTIRIGVTDADGVTSFSFAASDKPPNEPGTYRPKVTFTLPVGSQNCFIRLMNGGREVPVYWDGLTITEGSDDAGYFDGDTSGCYWEGTPHASRSIYPGPSWVPVGGKE